MVKDDAESSPAENEEQQVDRLIEATAGIIDNLGLHFDPFSAVAQMDEDVLQGLYQFRVMVRKRLAALVSPLEVGEAFSWILDVVEANRMNQEMHEEEAASSSSGPAKRPGVVWASAAFGPAVKEEKEISTSTRSSNFVNVALSTSRRRA